MEKSLTEFERGILETVKDGVDVFEYGIANACRLLAKRGLVDVTEPVSTQAGFGDGLARPMLYAVATAAGREALVNDEGRSTNEEQPDAV